MTPVFKSTFSIGKSILTLDKESKEGGADSIIEICKENSIGSLVLVEDSMTGFVTAHNRCQEEDIALVFGLRITCCNDINEDDNSDHKIVIFAKNDEGCRLLYKIYSYAHTGKGKVDFAFLNNIWTNDVELVIPFYDSFIFNNNLYLKKCIPDFSDISPTFWVERNNLPFDTLLERKVIKFSKSLQRPVRLVKSIFTKTKTMQKHCKHIKFFVTETLGKLLH